MSVDCETVYIEVNDEPGSITSYNFPGDYDNNMECSWELTSTASMQLTIVAFETERDYDFLTVRMICMYMYRSSDLTFDTNGHWPSAMLCVLVSVRCRVKVWMIWCLPVKCARSLSALIACSP